MYLYLTAYTGTISKWVKDLNVRAKTIKKKVDQWDIIKIKNFCALTGTMEKLKNNPQNRRRILQSMYLIRELYLEDIKKLQNSILKKDKLSDSKWAKELKRQFSKEDT